MMEVGTSQMIMLTTCMDRLRVFPMPSRRETNNMKTEEDCRVENPSCTSSVPPQLAFLFLPGCGGMRRRAVPFYRKTRNKDDKSNSRHANKETMISCYRCEWGELFMVFSGLKGVGVSRCREDGCLSGFCWTGQRGDRGGWGHLSCHRDALYLPLLRHTRVVDIQLAFSLARGKKFSFQKAHIKKNWAGYVESHHTVNTQSLCTDDD